MKVMSLNDYRKKREYSQYLKSLDNYQLGVEVDFIISNAALKLNLQSYPTSDFSHEQTSSQDHQQSQDQLFSKAKILLNEISSRLSGPAKTKLEKIVLETFQLAFREDI